MSVYEYLCQLISDLEGEVELPIRDEVILRGLNGDVSLILCINCVKCEIPIKTIKGTSKGFVVNDSITVDVSCTYAQEFRLDFEESTPKLLERLMKGKVDFKIGRGSGPRISFKLSGGPPIMECGSISEHLVGKEIKFLEKRASENIYVYKLGDVFLTLPETSTIEICLV